MGLFARAIIDELEGDVKKAARPAAAAWVRTVQQQPAVPFDTGALRSGIRLVTVTTRTPVAIRIASTTTNNGFDYPDHLDRTSPKHAGWWEKATADSTVEEAMDALVAAL